jgi:ABC-2 type transport system ATP-binding protein
VNGLDPEGILWVRTLLRHLAGEGRTVFVSSHLMSEMALTADHVVVIGRGRLIADRPVAELVADSSRRFVRVRTPERARLVPLLEASGGRVEAGDDGAFTVTGLSAEAIGDLAGEHRVRLHELTPLQASLEEAFMDLTRDSVEFGARRETPLVPPSEEHAPAPGQAR